MWATLALSWPFSAFLRDHRDFDIRMKCCFDDIVLFVSKVTNNETNSETQLKLEAGPYNSVKLFCSF